ncbi:MAG: zinc-ribbon domain-containing protein [Polyangiaceae bacterium]
MIVACHACPSQYSVPDAKVRGKKVRITCKHCGASIIVDGMDMPAATDVAPPSPLPRFQPLPALDVPSAARSRQEDVTLIARPKFGQGLSVHEEPTVIGQIPREALDFERAFSQRTKPPPSNDAPAPAASLTASESEEPLPRFASGRPSALPEVPESPHDETKRASPRAFARSEPPTGPFVAAPPSPIASPMPPPPPPVPTVLIKETRDDPTLVSSSIRSLRSPAVPQPKRFHLTPIVLTLLALVLASFIILKLR